jgi:hypothetical protein
MTAIGAISGTEGAPPPLDEDAYSAMAYREVELSMLLSPYNTLHEPESERFILIYCERA